MKGYLIGTFKHLDTSVCTEIYFKERQDIPSIEGYELKSVKAWKEPMITSGTIDAGSITWNEATKGEWNK